MSPKFHHLSIFWCVSGESLRPRLPAFAMSASLSSCKHSVYVVKPWTVVVYFIKLRYFGQSDWKTINFRRLKVFWLPPLKNVADRSWRTGLWEGWKPRTGPGRGRWMYRWAAFQTVAATPSARIIFVISAYCVWGSLVYPTALKKEKEGFAPDWGVFLPTRQRLMVTSVEAPSSVRTGSSQLLIVSPSKSTSLSRKPSIIMLSQCI